MAKDITRFLAYYYRNREYMREVTTLARLGSERRFYTLVTTVEDAETYDYDGDYWGTASEYRSDNIDLMLSLTPFVGSMVRYDWGDGDVDEGVLVGILIDDKYNGTGHTLVLLDIEGEEVM